MDTFDYVIVGAGSAGCVLASRLSEDPSVTVCVLEAGPRDWHPYIHLPAGFIKTFYMKSINWGYQQEPGPYTNGRSIYAPRGKTLGGSSSINGHVYNRGQRQDFDTWAQMGNRGWSYSDVLPHFKRMEKRIGAGDEQYRGRDGSLHVTTMEWKDTLCEAFMDGAVSLGIPRNPDYNGAIQEGVSYVQRTIQNGRRVSSATAFLRPASKRPNVEIRTHAHATGVMLEGKRAVGVRYSRGGRGGVPVEVRARKEVILCGGAYNSPQLLQLSGIGAPELLQEHGIEVRHALRSVGEGLQDHYAPRTVARVKNIKTINELARGLNLWGEALKWALTRRGILSLSPTMVYCFWHSGETAESSDLQLTFTPASYKEGVQGQLEDEPGMTVASWQQRPESRGYVRIRSADPFAQPIIQTNYLTAELDRRVIVAGMKLARRLLASAPLAPYYAYEDFPGPKVQSDDELLAAAIQRATTTFHPGCSCRMGPAEATWATVDDQLRVHGLQGLRVADASIMPRMISANLNAATLMIGDKAADLILGKADAGERLSA
ncbi:MULTISPECIES: GMC family oxidoreductase [Bradyrhizobium]|jgi:choline dehydrogenase|uniref:GMC family oxidoreductase N-terminal domain-containing protein n=8 Tax=Bradyrhizobium TaxID=374 RepID=A0ABS5GF38_9BRAD|nr:MULTISPECIES: GMC family oxidoreductase N-terminal domain-containing protein [Bradyrhizobium]MBR1139962.1 GMC family oxidoreductase N-terminal domain-containing protein [Bradyrhizobium denitrificans]MDU1495904.1 GMC family oxidoreductase N-terminal domain-containing protein [Bradyrhizobium sp.]MDU1546055.1 GMC family oxidoreductase N-terminal domain-containing protein [Bradyrhizobium sp.]MDU1803350.1 GMC family oxidoreductase N-terminal domain-containing protein [Bradyrhizobium sp.]MDU30944